MVDGLTALEALAAPRAGAFLYGNTPTLADICLIPQLYNARRFGVRLDAFPTLRRVDGQDLFWWGARTPDALARLARRFAGG